jgi:uncharacterized protein YjbJ (UPF0337 family)
MKSSTKDQTAGAYHEMKGAVKEIAGILSGNSKLEAAGLGEKIGGKVRKKVGQIEKVMGK